MAALDPHAHIAMLERELEWAHLKIQVLEERLRQQRIKMLGPFSETLSDLQLELLAEEEPGATREEVEGETRREPVIRRERKPHPGRQRLPENLPRVEQVIRCVESNCGLCGSETAVIGYDESEQLDVEPARYFVRVIKREKRACRSCANPTVTAAPLAPRIVDKGLASDRVVVDTVVAKYCDHLPLYRQAVMLEREAGIEIGRATLDGWVMRVGESLQMIVAAMRADLLGEWYLQADETIVPVQMHDGRRADHQAYLWQYGRPGGETVFDFQLGRGRDGPRKFLGRWEGVLQTDGYQAYDGVGGPKLVHVGCWAHARRKFVDAVKVNPKDGAAVAMVTRMDALFLVDRHARERQMSVEERLALRREHAESWAEEIRRECVALSKTTLPKSTLGQAVTYTLNMWTKLRRCFDYAEVELSNNLAENSMRGVAVGRKNWLHVGSAQAGPKVAAILSVVESCRRLGVPVRQYLLDVLPGLDQRKRSEVGSLTPARWSAARS
ncbi:MAG TPA: IS66 family transposase [Candidatus Baltobacteraceae bacterium]|nr:IS66 family transposase [Candidatus Baltobacteraceae bacterium]